MISGVALSSRHLADEINAAAGVYAFDHHLAPGDKLPPDVLVKSGAPWWSSTDGHSMPLSLAVSLFVRGSVTKNGEPYALIGVFSDSGFPQRRGNSK